MKAQKEEEKEESKEEEIKKALERKMKLRKAAGIDGIPSTEVWNMQGKSWT